MSQLCLLLIQVLEFMSIDKHQDHLIKRIVEVLIEANLIKTTKKD